MAINVAKTVETLNRMTVTQLRERYAEVFGESTRSYNKQYLVKRIAWRIQAIGGRRPVGAGTPPGAGTGERCGPADPAAGW